MDKLITPYAYAKKHGIKLTTLYYWIKTNKIPFVRKTVERVLIKENEKIK